MIYSVVSASVLAAQVEATEPRGRFWGENGILRGKFGAYCYREMCETVSMWKEVNLVNCFSAMKCGNLNYILISASFERCNLYCRFPFIICFSRIQWIFNFLGKRFSPWILSQFVFCNLHWTYINQQNENDAHLILNLSRPKRYLSNKAGIISNHLSIIVPSIVPKKQLV